MPGLLPPLRFTGARVLRDGVLQERSIAVAGGRITRGPLPAVDLSGYLILPGVIDLMAVLPAPCMDPDTARCLLDEADRLNAARGVTTLCLHQGWSWEGGADSPAAAAIMAEAMTLAATRSVTDLRMMLRVEHAQAPDIARIMTLIRRHGPGLVMFSDRAAEARMLADGDPEAFDALARRLGHDAESLRLTLDGLTSSAAQVPRALCLLAEEFDRLGVIYGSMEDATGEAREHHSMLGAGLCLTPRTYRAAAAARAVSDPVALSARDILGRMETRTLDLADLQRADAIVSDGAAMSLADLALTLASRGLMDLPAAWSLVSERPARLLRLPDRGRLDHGMRADLTVVNAATGKVEATISGGRLAYLSGMAGARFLGKRIDIAMAAE